VDDFFLRYLGTVANKLSDEFYRPSVVIRTGKKVSTGSCRSIPEFNLIESFDGMPRTVHGIRRA